MSRSPAALAAKPFVTIAMPALNEERYIGRALATLAQIPETIDYEILVLDGGSTDRTAEIVAQKAQADPRIRLVANPQRIQSAGVNRAAEMADPRSRYLLRADCHAHYPPQFVARCIEELRMRDVVSVTVPMRTTGVSCFQKAVAAAQNSRLGTGGAEHRGRTGSRYVAHGHHAAFRLDVFRAFGGYDERFTHNEDAELDVRLTRAGHRIWLCAEAPVSYYPRASVAALARQYFNHGRGRASTMLKHRTKPRLRQLLPIIAGLGCLAGLLLGATVHPTFVLVPVAYFVAAIMTGAIVAARIGAPCALASGFAATVMHMSWATGFAMRFAEGESPTNTAARPMSSIAGRCGELRRTPS